MNPQLMDMIKGYESCSLVAYKKKGDRWTIGWGNTFYEDGKPVKQGDRITQQRADELFETILTMFYDGVKKAVPAKYPSHVVDACTSLAYNIGEAAFGKSTCLQRLKEGDLDGAAEALQWFNQRRDGTGKKVQERGLVVRRAREAGLMLGGWDSGLETAEAHVEEARPNVLHSRKFWAAIMSLVGTVMTIPAETWPTFFTQTRGVYDQLVANGYNASVAFLGTGLALAGAGLVTYFQHRDMAASRVQPKGLVNR